MKASDLFIKCLEAEGVEYIFGVAGEENLDLLESIRQSNIKYIPVRHEQSAGFMAATVGRLTGKPGVALSTLGPGATNLVTAAAYAKLGAMPMVMLTGQKPIKNNPQANFQIVDIVEMMKPLTKFTTQISFADKVPARIREAFRLAEEERPGPTHIELPKDVATSETDHEPMIVSPIRRPIAEEKAINKAVEMIENAKKPLILVGAGANRKRTSKMLNEFIQKTGIPFVNTQMGKGVLDERSDEFIGTAALLKGDFVHEAIEASDLIINIGHDIIEKPPFVMSKNGAKVIHINFVSAEVHEVYFPQLEVIGDVANAIWQIKEKIKVSKAWDFSKFFEVRDKITRNIYELKLESTPGKVAMTDLVKTLRANLEDEDILALDNGMFKLWFARFYKAYLPNTLLLDNALATMGAGLPSAIAAKVINPEKNVVSMSGDGGFMMTCMELETAVRLNLDLTVIILNDNGLGMIKWEQEHKGFADFGLSHSNPDFIKFAESFGVKGYRVKSSTELENFLQRALKEQGVKLIEVMVDYSKNNQIFKI